MIHKIPIPRHSEFIFSRQVFDQSKHDKLLGVDFSHHLFYILR